MSMVNDCWRSLVSLARTDLDQPSRPEEKAIRAQRHRRFHWTLSLITVGVAGACFAGFSASQLQLPLNEPFPGWLQMGLLLSGALICLCFRGWRLHNSLIMGFWTAVVTKLAAMPVYLAVRQGSDLQDDCLARVDAALGVDALDVVRFAAQFPQVQHLLNVVYDLLSYLVLAAVMLPPLLGQMQRAKQFAVAVLLALAVTVPVLACWPALGPWTMYEGGPSERQLRFLGEFSALRSETFVNLNPFHTVGLVTFPSFHTLLAALAAMALWGIPYLRWPVAGLSILIVVSTVTTGWHYLIDVWAGLALALASWVAARGLLRLEASGPAAQATPATAPEVAVVDLTRETSES